VHHLFVVDVDERDRVRAALREDGVLAGVHYPTPVHLQPAWHWLGLRVGELPATERAAERLLSLPCFPGMHEEEQDEVIDALGRALALSP
jgi:dTDP-4-amino-4,6-dideoxygalactose transaminase